LVLRALGTALLLLACSAPDEARPWGHCFSAVVRAERRLSPDPAVRFFELESDGSMVLVDVPCDLPLRPGASALIASYMWNPEIDPWWVFLRYDPERRGCQTEDHTPPEAPPVEQRCTLAMAGRLGVLTPRAAY
jgi:hypothetical protein